jgi:hypothetical protein
MWTEILSEHVGTVHFGGQHVLFPIYGNDDKRNVENEIVAAKKVIECRTAKRHIDRQYQQLAAELEQQKRAAERLNGTEYAGLL